MVPSIDNSPILCTEYGIFEFNFNSFARSSAGGNNARNLRSMVSQEKEPIICVKILDSGSMVVHEVAEWCLLVLFLFLCFCLFVVSIVIPNLILSNQFLVLFNFHYSNSFQTIMKTNLDDDEYL